MPTKSKAALLRAKGDAQRILCWLCQLIDQGKTQRRDELELYLGDGRNQRAGRREEGTLVEEFNIGLLIHIAL